LSIIGDTSGLQHALELLAMTMAKVIGTQRIR